MREITIHNWVLKKEYGGVSVAYNTTLSGKQHRCNFKLTDIEVVETILKMLSEEIEVVKQRRNPVGYIG